MDVAAFLLTNCELNAYMDILMKLRTTFLNILSSALNLYEPRVPRSSCAFVSRYVSRQPEVTLEAVEGHAGQSVDFI